MLERAIDDYRTASPMTFFDRAIPDLVAYAQIFELDTSAAMQAATQHRYNNPVFFLPSWPEIYTTDDERTMSFEMAHDFGELIRAVYDELGYEIEEVPRGTPLERANFVLGRCHA